jgi:hypothetical protein
MSIAFVQAATAVSIIGSAAGSVSLSGVRAGNTLICLLGQYNTAETTTTWTVVDSETGTPNYNQDVLVVNNGTSTGMCASLYNALAGAHTVTATAAGVAAADCFGNILLAEFSGIATNGFDKHATQSIFGTATGTSTTGTLAAANELLIAVMSADGSLAGATSPPTGGPGTFINLFSSLTGGFYEDFDYQIQTTGTTGVAANWGTTTANTTMANLISTYKAATAGITQNQMLMGIG